ncbi:MAG: hypothetical protein KA004_08980 [Verrucomicrobiales bacterium]|nr:hypothetical protein [Verrucomicrobiales bacterium]
MITGRIPALLLGFAAWSANISGSAAEPPKPQTETRLFAPDGRPVDDSFFPVAVWLQQPRNAAKFKEAGINLYVGLWQGPTDAQLQALKKAGMPVICDQNETGLAHRNDPLIAAWMHGDEPDNAQALPGGKGYGPPILPEKIVEHYHAMRKADATRPVLLNLGQGVAYDNYIGRGVRRNHPEDYVRYLKGCDIASFDIYPVVHETPEITGKLEYVPRGVERLVKWSGGAKPVWTCIECTDIGGVGRKASPAQIHAEAWMAIIRGSRGLIYFVHQFKPSFKESALLEDPVTLTAVTALNRQIRDLAPVLNSPTLTDILSITPANSSVAAMVKRRKDATYLFAANFGPAPANVRFELRGIKASASAEVLGESRQIPVTRGTFEAPFVGYAVHLFRIP